MMCVGFLNFFSLSFNIEMHSDRRDSNNVSLKFSVVWKVLTIELSDSIDTPKRAITVKNRDESSTDRTIDYRSFYTRMILCVTGED